MTDEQHTEAYIKFTEFRKWLVEKDAKLHIHNNGSAIFASVTWYEENDRTEHNVSHITRSYCLCILGLYDKVEQHLNAVRDSVPKV